MRKKYTMMKIIALVLTVALSVALAACVGHGSGSGGGGGGKNCKTGKPCGNTCIARNKTCRQ